MYGSTEEDCRIGLICADSRLAGWPQSGIEIVGTNNHEIGLEKLGCVTSGG